MAGVLCTTFLASRHHHTPARTTYYIIYIVSNNIVVIMNSVTFHQHKSIGANYIVMLMQQEVEMDQIFKSITDVVLVGRMCGLN